MSRELELLELEFHHSPGLVNVSTRLCVKRLQNNCVSCFYKKIVIALLLSYFINLVFTCCFLCLKIIKIIKNRIVLCF